MNSNLDESAQSNPAVARCWEAGQAAYQANLAQGMDQESAQRAANIAYRRALPPLKGIRNTRNFIACVAFGAVMGIFPGPESSRLLYAAQIAHTTRRTRKRSAKSADPLAEKSHSGAIQDGVSAIQEPSSEPGQAA